jgi:hypothetical protein
VSGSDFDLRHPLAIYRSSDFSAASFAFVARLGFESGSAPLTPCLANPIWVALGDTQSESNGHMAAAPNYIAPVVIFSLIAWRMYRRVRRHIGRQPFQPKRLVVRLVIYGVLGCVVAFVSLGHPAVLLGLACGIALGGLLGWVGLKLTHFEPTADGHFYTPNIYIGVTLSCLLVARIAYRFIVLSPAAYGTNQPPPVLGQSPLTLGLFGLLVGYYFVYYIGLLVRCRKSGVAPVQIEKV